MKTVISKTAILPIITTLFLGISYVTGHSFSKDTIDFWANLVAALGTSAITIWGIVKNHRKIVDNTPSTPVK